MSLSVSSSAAAITPWRGERSSWLKEPRKSLLAFSDIDAFTLCTSAMIVVPKARRKLNSPSIVNMRFGEFVQRIPDENQRSFMGSQRGTTATLLAPGKMWVIALAWPSSEWKALEALFILPLSSGSGFASSMRTSDASSSSDCPDKSAPSKSKWKTLPSGYRLIRMLIKRSGNLKWSGDIAPSMLDDAVVEKPSTSQYCSTS